MKATKKSKLTVLEKAEACVKFYEAHRGDPRLEPRWTYSIFEAAFAMVGGKAEENDDYFVNEAYGAITTPDGQYDFFPFGKRTLQEGFKVGTTSWVFFGRHGNPQLEYCGWIICVRRYGNVVAYMAYHPDRPMGSSALTGDEIGPCQSLDETKAYIDADMT